jgi:exodeoxyribonuclease V alpha subunit
MFIITDKISDAVRETTYYLQTNYPQNTKIYIDRYEAESRKRLNKEQKQSIKNALENRVSVITGGPGRGKTTMIDGLAYCWTRSDPHAKVLLLAPTGKAMNKLCNDTCADYSNTDKKYPTKTIDNVLCTIEHTKVNSYDTEKRLVIIDESSMIDVEKAARLFKDMPSCQFCFVGDADQLPPISPGNFFKDLIESAPATGIPVTYLITPLRNSGVILDNADKINKNDTSLIYNINDMPFFPQAADDAAALDAIIDQYNDERQDNPDITQIALLCPVRKGVIGTNNINISIQNITCPENTAATSTWDARRQQHVYTAKGRPIQETIFGDKSSYTRLRVGDIVINTKNKPGIMTFKYENNDYWNGKSTENINGIFNGDCGRIIGYIPPDYSSKDEDHSHMIIEFFDGRIANLDITAGDADNIELGYALTVHKAQGCEYQTVIYVSPNALATMPKSFACKNLVYTAVTRAKSRVVVIGSKEALNNCIQNNIPKKNSNLKERLMACAPTTNVP